jgi:hypothetical protein
MRWSADPRFGYHSDSPMLQSVEQSSHGGGGGFRPPGAQREFLRPCRLSHSNEIFRLSVKQGESCRLQMDSLYTAVVFTLKDCGYIMDWVRGLNNLAEISECCVIPNTAIKPSGQMAKHTSPVHETIFPSSFSTLHLQYVMNILFIVSVSITVIFVKIRCVKFTFFFMQIA